MSYPTASTLPKPRVVSKDYDHRLVEFYSEMNGFFERHIAFEKKAGFNAMGGQQWATVSLADLDIHRLAELMGNLLRSFYYEKVS